MTPRPRDRPDTDPAATARPAGGRRLRGAPSSGAAFPFPRPTRQRWWAPFGQPAPDSDQPPRPRAPAACLSWSRPFDLTGSHIATGGPERGRIDAHRQFVDYGCDRGPRGRRERGGRMAPLVHDVSGHVGRSTRQLRGLQAGNRAGKPAHSVCSSWPWRVAAQEQSLGRSRPLGSLQLSVIPDGERPVPRPNHGRTESTWRTNQLKARRARNQPRGPSVASPDYS